MASLAERHEPKIGDIIRPYCRKRPRLLLTIGLYKDGETAVLQHGPPHGTPHGPSAGASPHVSPPIYEIGSITKVFTGALLARAIRDGRARLNDPVTRFMPDLASNGSLAEHPVTLRQLVTHTSGLPSLPPSFIFRLLFSRKVRSNPYVHFSTDDMLRFLSRFTFPARRPFRYSNLGAGLLGHILANVYQGDYETVLLEHICRPLGLADTAIRLSGEQRERLVPGYTGQNKPAANWDFRSLEGAGALRSTARDLLDFVQVNVEGTGHPAGDLLQDTHQVLHEEAGGPAVGMAWMVERKSGIIWHNGGTGGYASFLGFNKENKTGVVVLSNYEHTSQNHVESVDGIGFLVLALLGGRR